MKALSRRYRVYALDFWGFGESDKRRESYTIADFVELVDRFMDSLGIRSAPLIGHSMGGTVALSVALAYPHRVEKVVVVGSPLVGRALCLPLRLASYPFVAFVVWNSPLLLRLGIKAFAPSIARNWRQWYEMILRDLSRTTLEAFLWSLNSLHQTDLRPYLEHVSVRTLGIYGRRDNIVHPSQAQLLLRIPGAKVRMMERSRHFPMLDEPERFHSALLRFLSAT